MEQITLRACRVNAGLTQEAAAKLLGVAIRTLQKWERGVSYPNAKQIQQICDGYGVRFEQIIF